MLTAKNSRAIYIWGAGSSGKITYERFKDRINISGFIDSNNQKWATKLLDKEIFSPTILDDFGRNKPFIIIASDWANEIEDELKSRGYQLDEDFISRLQLEYNYKEQRAKLNELYDDCQENLSLDDLKKQQFNDEFWFWMNTRGYRENEILRNIFSPLPDEQIQKRLTGVAGDISLRHAFNQYMIIKEVLNRNYMSLADFDKILDFGCGYGRLLRYFIKDTSPDKLYGTDINQELINWCKTQNKFGHYYQNGVMPPTEFANNYFSLAFAFSVFTHLSEKSHLVWRDELARILMPNGILIYTIWAHPSRTITGYHKPHFDDYDKLINEYNAGRFCYSNKLYQSSETYGEALVPLEYIKKNWLKQFDLVDFVDNHPNSPTQSYVVLRKK